MDRRWIRRLGQSILATGLVVAPWLFGGVEDGVFLWLLLAAQAAAALGLWASFRKAEGEPPAVGGAIVPVLLGVGLGVLQITPLPPAVVSVLSPKAYELRQVLGVGESAADSADAADAAEAGAGEPAQARSSGWQTVSLYPAATRRDLALLICGGLTYVAAAALFRSRTSLAVLALVVAVNGAAIACFGVVQDAVTDGKHIWGVEVVRGGTVFGPFINQNNAGGYLNLCLAAAVGVLVFCGTIREAKRSPNGGTQRTELSFHLSQQVLGMGVVAALLMAGIVASLSRGAFLAMLFAVVVTVVVLFQRLRSKARGRHLLLGIVGLAAVLMVALLVLLGLVPNIVARIGTIVDPEVIERHSVLNHWLVSLRAIPDFLIAGSGLGSYGYVYPLYEKTALPFWFPHPENQYLEALVVAGIAALLLVVAAIVLVARDAALLIRHARGRTHLAVGAAGLFAIASQVVAATIDFGLFTPSNLMLMAAVVGIVHAQARSLAADRAGRAETARGGGRWFQWAVPGLTLLAGCYALFVQLHFAAVEPVNRRAREMVRDLREHTPEELAAVAAELQSAAAWMGDHPEVLLARADLRLGQYRTSAFAEMMAEAPPEARDLAWLITSPEYLHERIHTLDAAGQTEELAALRQHPLIESHIRPAYEALHAARDACPLYTRAHLRLAELCGLFTRPERDKVHLERAELLAPAQPDYLHTIGGLHLAAGRTDEAWAAWRRSLALSPAHLEEIVLAAGPFIAADEGVAAKLLPPRLAVLAPLARLELPEELAGARETLLAYARANLADAPLENQEDEAERQYALATLAQAAGDPAAAAEHFEQAVELRPLEISWQYQYATLLFEQGELDRAHELARRCTRLEPRNAQYRRLLVRITEARLEREDE